METTVNIKIEQSGGLVVRKVIWPEGQFDDFKVAQNKRKSEILIDLFYKELIQRNHVQKNISSQITKIVPNSPQSTKINKNKTNEARLTRLGFSDIEMSAVQFC